MSKRGDRLFKLDKYGCLSDKSSVISSRIIQSNRMSTYFNVRRTKRRYHSNMIALYTAGSCARNGQPDAEAGVGVFFGRNSRLNGSDKGAAAWEKNRVETSQRAELRAAILALEIIYVRVVSKTTITTFVILSDSTYLINSVTKWVYKWKKNGWLTTRGTSVKNQDLLVELDETLERLWGLGFKVLFLKCAREDNHEAHQLAKMAIGKA
jgi:ribonuclease HI